MIGIENGTSGTANNLVRNARGKYSNTAQDGLTTGNICDKAVCDRIGDRENDRQTNGHAARSWWKELPLLVEGLKPHAASSSFTSFYDPSSQI